MTKRRALDILLKGNKITDDRSESGRSALALGWKVGTLFVTCAFSSIKCGSVSSCPTWPQVISGAASGIVVKYITTRDPLEDAWGTAVSIAGSCDAPEATDRLRVSENPGGPHRLTPLEAGASRKPEAAGGYPCPRSTVFLVRLGSCCSIPPGTAEQKFSSFETSLLLWDHRTRIKT